MRLETFFEKFEVLAEAPNGVEKLRQLVLQLAVQGQLAPQRTEDGNARSIFGAGVTRSTAAAEVDPRYPVPFSWCWVRFAAVGEQRLGKMLDKRGNRGELKPYLRNTNVQWMRFELGDIKQLRLEPDELAEYRLRSGDLLICEGGEPGRCAIWRDTDREMYFQKALHRVRPRKGILPDYLAICLRIDAQNGVLERAFTGATIKHFTGRSLSEYSIPIPPLAEQKRIVTKVGELMALCDRLESQEQLRATRLSTLAQASLARFAGAPTEPNLNFLFHDSYAIQPADLRKAILTLAVQGKLVLQDSSEGSVEDLLRSIYAEKIALVNGGLLNKAERVGPLPSDATLGLPRSWALAPLSALCVSVTDGDHLPPPKAETGVPFLVISDVRWGGIRFAGCRHVTQEYFDALDWIRRPREGDVLYTLVGSLGIPVLVSDPAPFCVQRHIGILRPSKYVSSQYLAYALASGYVFDQAVAIATGIAQKTVPLAGLRRIAIPLPPLSEQRRIVARVDQLMALVDRLETGLASSQVAAGKLSDAMVAELAV